MLRLHDLFLDLVELVDVILLLLLKLLIGLGNGVQILKCGLQVLRQLRHLVHKVNTLLQLLVILIAQVNCEEHLLL